MKVIELDPEPRHYVVDLGERSYPVYVDTGLLDKVGLLVERELPTVKKCAVVTSEVIWEKHGAALMNSFRKVRIRAGKVFVPDGEEAKSWPAAGKLIGDLLELNLDRKSAVIAFGGGAVGDLAGFVASIYLRGVNLVQVPSTLLAQVDSSVGGKTAINHPKGKNLIGSFHQPSLVVSDPDILSTLPTEDFRSGLGEVIKHGVIADAALFKFIEDKAISLMRRDPFALTHVIGKSVEIKGRFVSVDEWDDKGIRAILNYGHTVGHALEILSSNVLRHGEAVALGMIFASLLSRSLDLISDRDIEKQRLLLKELGFDMNPPALSSTRIIEMMHKDKKVEDESIRFVLPTGIGSSPVLKPVPESLIIRTLEDEGYG